MTDKEAMKLALGALEDSPMSRKNKDAIDALRETLAEHAMNEVQRLGQEIEQCKYPDCKCPTENPCLKGLAQPEQEPVADYIAARDMLDAQPVPPRTWVGLTDEDLYVVGEEESCSFIAGAKWSEDILKEKNT